MLNIKVNCTERFATTYLLAACCVKIVVGNCSVWPFSACYMRVKQSYTDEFFRLSSKKESITENAHVVGALERLWSNSEVFSKEQLRSLPHAESMGHAMYHSWAQVTEEYLPEMIIPSVECEDDGNLLIGWIQTYARCDEKCRNAKCSIVNECSCYLPCHYHALIENLEEDDQQLPKFRNKVVVNHIKKVRSLNR